MSKIRVNGKKIVAIIASCVMLNSCGRALRRYVSEPEYDTESSISSQEDITSSANVEIKNVDVQSGEIVPGNIMDIRNSEGHIVYEYITTSEPHYLVLEQGKYTLEEANSALGYRVSTEVVNFTVSKDDMVKVVFYDTPREKVKTK